MQHLCLERLTALILVLRREVWEIPPTPLYERGAFLGFIRGAISWLKGVYFKKAPMAVLKSESAGGVPAYRLG